tara:strand:- start:2460 stop:2660 length:201 start_codon:yes stop_codon:yes gene_type:complete
MLAMREDEIPVDITCNLESLRFMHHTFSKAYQNWAGGDPEEQVKLRACRDAFYIILLETLLQNEML